jgi:hypothetical protein
VSENPDMPPTPAVGEPLVRATEAFGVRDKLAMYSLDMSHQDDGPKALGFKLILGITLSDAGIAACEDEPAITAPTAPRWEQRGDGRRMGAHAGLHRERCRR